MIGYASKSLPKACVNYGITELEMTGLLVNMENWKFYLGRKDFDAAVDHRAIPYIYTAGQIVYLYFPGQSMLNTGSKKIRCEFVGPLAIWKCISPNQFLLMSLDGKLYPYLIEETRIKPGFVRTTKGNVTHMSALRQVIKSGELIDEKQHVL